MFLKCISINNVRLHRLEDIEMFKYACTILWFHIIFLDFHHSHSFNVQQTERIGTESPKIEFAKQRNTIILLSVTLEGNITLGKTRFSSSIV